MPLFPIQLSPVSRSTDQYECTHSSSVFRQGHSQLSKQWNYNNRKLLAYLKDTEMEDLGSTFWEMFSIPRDSDKSLLFGKLLQKLLLPHGVSEVAQWRPQSLLSSDRIKCEELERPFPRQILEKQQHAFESWYISPATMTFRWPCCPVWE